MINLRPNEKRAKTAITLIWIVFAFEMASLVSSILQYYFLKSVENGEILTIEAATANDRRQIIIGLATTAVFIVSAVTFIQWFRRAYFNMHLLRGKHLQHAEGWASGAWFVPIMSLFRPYGIMKEIYENAEELLYKEKLIEVEDRRFQTIGAWWTLWVITNILSSALNRIEAKADSLETLTYTTIGHIAGSILFIPLTLLAVKVIKNYVEMEKLLPELQEAGTLSTTTSTDLLDS